MLLKSQHNTYIIYFYTLLPLVPPTGDPKSPFRGELLKLAYLRDSFQENHFAIALTTFAFCFGSQ